MSAVSVARVPEGCGSVEEQIMVTVEEQAPLLLSLEDAHKLRDALCVMVGMPKRKKVKGLR